VYVDVDCGGADFTRDRIVCDVTHSSHYSLSLFTQLYYFTLQGLRGVAIIDYLDYDEDYAVPGYYDEDYDLDFEEEPLDAYFFDDEDLEFVGPRKGGRMQPQHWADGEMNHAFKQLKNTGEITSDVARNLSNGEIRSVIRASGLRVSETRIDGDGNIIEKSPFRTVARKRGLPSSPNPRTYYYYD
jgi:hypothetical protein